MPFLNMITVTSNGIRKNNMLEKLSRKILIHLDPDMQNIVRWLICTGGLTLISEWIGRHAIAFSNE